MIYHHNIKILVPGSIENFDFENVLFKTDDYQLDEITKEDLEKLYKELEKDPTLYVHIDALQIVMGRLPIMGNYPQIEQFRSQII